MPPKRPNDATEGLSGRDRKKQKLAVARNIAVQSTPPSNAEAGPSDTNNSAMTLDIFSRAFEITAIQNSIKAAGSSAAHRVWQTLPRELRRRAASHDVRRVPARLRQKAQAEMDIKKTVAKHKAKRGKNKRISKTDAYLKRQRDKVWLETHIWHAKRMKMETKWGYRLAIHPSEKAFRSSHRAAVHGSILHDASYQSLIEISGQQRVLKKILDNCCSPQSVSPSAVRYVSGARTIETLFYESKAYPFGLIARVTIMWQPLASSASEPQQPVEEEGEQNQEAQASAPRRKEKAWEEAPIPDKTLRSLWIRAHPAVHDQVFDALHESASSVLDSFKNSSASEEPVEVEIADMRGKVNIFEIMGPKSSQVIKGALQPVSADDRAGFKEFWPSLANLQSTASVPRGMVVGFTVTDPRLKFPPQNAKPSTNSSQFITLPTSKLAQSAIWNESERKAPKFRKKDLDERREKNLIPGTKLTALRQDDRIPVLLIQNSLEHSRNAESIHGWTLIIPSGWAMAFFSSLIYTGTRVGGQRECQSQSFEAGVPYFPRDFPLTIAGEEYATEKETEERELWERKPPAKRPNFEKLRTRSPWRPDWDVVLGKKKEKSGEDDSAMVEEEDEHVVKSMKPWLLCGDNVPSLVEKLCNVSAPTIILRAELNASRAKCSLDPLNGVSSLDLLNGALVSVRVKMHKRGSPDDIAMLYAMSDEEILEWEKDVNKSVAEEVIDIDEEDRSKPVIPPSSSIIGYITTGHFSLMRGEAFGLASMPLVKYIELDRQAKRMHPDAPKLVVRVRNPSQDICRVAYVELL
ncbi:POP1-domain-containing protein [Hymenopellis radicata]|nr:POP1-domain-containing protein [Hymenopellis radicata]